MIAEMRRNAGAIAQALVVPHGFTLAVAGTLTIIVGQRGYPGAMAVWLFIVGANAAFLCLLGAAGGHRRCAPSPPAGVAVFNAAPVVVVPIVYLATLPIHRDDLAFLLAGAMVVWSYISLMAAYIGAIERRKPRPGGDSR